MQLLGEEDLTKAKAISMSLPYIDLNELRVDDSILKNLSKELAQKYNAVPFGFSDGSISVGMLNPNNVQIIEFIEKKSGYPVRPYMASMTNIRIYRGK
jgi:type IV pilus assembly protein PilB